MSLNMKWEKWMLLGARLGCHQMPERSFFVRGYQFPLCARCTGLMIGYVIGITSWHFVDVSPVWSAAICIPLIVDGVTQYVRWRESDQALRPITGILCGIGCVRLEIFMFITIECFIQRRLWG